MPCVVLPAGAVLLPAFVDEHVHLLATLAARTSIDLAGAASVAEVLERLHVGATTWRRGDALRTYVRAWGLDEHELRERRLPTASEIERAVGGAPVVIHHRTGHLTLANEEGRQRAATSEGQFAESRRPLPAKAQRQWAQLRREGARLGAELAALGVVEVCDATPAHSATLGALARLPLPQRVRAMVDPRFLGPPSPGRWSAPRSVRTVPAGAQLPGLQLEAVKIMPPRLAPEDIAGHTARAHELGLRVAVHAVDVDELQAALDGGLGPGDRVEHAGLCLPEQLEELAARSITVVTQPTFVTRRAAKYRAELSPVEQAWLYRLRSLVAAGVAVRFSSDTPVVPPGPLEQVTAAATRRLGPDERLDVATALAAVSRPAAPGDPADLVVLGADPLAVDAAFVEHLAVLATWRSGELLHGDPAHWPSCPPARSGDGVAP